MSAAEPETQGAGRRRALVPLAVSAIGFVAAIGLFAASAWIADEPEPIVRSETLDVTALSSREAESRAVELVEWALTAVYDAFEQDGEEAIYSALERAAAGDALETLYLQRRAALVDRGLENANQQLHELELLSVSAARQGDVVSATADWRVLGILGHETHRHVRGNAYGADLVFERVAEGWRLTGFILTNVDRTDAGAIVEAPAGHAGPGEAPSR